jgi:uncharacterized membrane protein YhhN
VNKQKDKADQGKSSAIKIAVPVIGWSAIIGLLLYRPKWVFLGTICFVLFVLYFGFVFLRAKEAKREGGWLVAILTAIGVMIFILLWFLLGFHVEKGHLPL